LKRLLKKWNQDGLCLVNAMPIAPSVFINDDETGLHYDYEKWFEQLIPHEPIDQYEHNRTGDDMLMRI
jgi:thiamine phosphate synthase YjbQ (UPF0047 family)